MDRDLQSIQQARDLVHQARAAQHRFKTAGQADVDRIVAAMARAGEQQAERLGRMAHEETGFGRPESKTAKNLFATKTLHARMAGMKTAGVIRTLEGGSIWEIATPMGVVAALIPSTNPTSTAMYKAIIAAKARCGIVMSPHPRAVECTAEALRVVAEAAYAEGAPEGLFGCMTAVDLAGTDALLEHEHTDVILATGGTAMVRAAYSKGKPAYGVGSGNVPVYVDRSADVEKAAADLLYGTSFDWGTLCSTERSVVADYPVKTRLVEAMKREGAYFLNDHEKTLLRNFILKKGRLNVDQVGQAPHRIAAMAGFSAPGDARALVAEVDAVGKAEPLSMETLSPILSFYTADGWQAGCDRCIEILRFGGIGHTLGLHCTNDRVIEAFALQKPSMRIVVNTVAALGSVGYTNRLFPAMTLGPGTLGGSITSDNVSPMHLLNIKRLAFETDPVHAGKGEAGRGKRASRSAAAPAAGDGSWMDTIEARLLARAGNPSATPPPPSARPAPSSPLPPPAAASTLPLPDAQIEQLIRKFKK
ncbi:MAG: aldehyde dehydrogenase family protein [Rhodothermales bacterium]|nr:aldehyde dehydrogenase family protein [Rhodothermales bacterium]